MAILVNSSGGSDEPVVETIATGTCNSYTISIQPNKKMDEYKCYIFILYDNNSSGTESKATFKINGISSSDKDESFWDTTIAVTSQTSKIMIVIYKPAQLTHYGISTFSNFEVSITNFGKYYHAKYYLYGIK